MNHPLDWEVHDLSHYATYNVEDAGGLIMGVSLLVPLDAQHRNSGANRLALFGGATETVSIAAAAIFPYLPQPIADAYLHFPASSARTLIPDNCMACPWLSVETMIRYLHLQLK